MSYTLRHISTFYEEQNTIREYLQRNGELSLSASVEAILSKTLIIMGASFFEKCIREAVFEKVKRLSSLSVSEFCRILAIERKYHSWFNWNNRNANQFFSLFGEHGKLVLRERVLKDEKLCSSVESFMYVGSQRNAIVHEDFASQTITATAAEIMTRIYDALHFVNFVADELFEQLK